MNLTVLHIDSFYFVTLIAFISVEKYGFEHKEVPFYTLLKKIDFIIAVDII